jgi:DNA-cytosine methyltransferase
MKPLNVLSLFDGMSCGRVALERAGIPVANYFASEIDKYAIQIAMKNYPNIIQLGDVQGWKEWDIPVPDLIIGGSPCQGFSLSGKGLNFDDPRSALFFEFHDILVHYQKLNPNLKYLLENVKMKKTWADVITDYMQVEPVLIDSALVSAQSRKRLYWANWDIQQPEDRGIYLKDIIENGFVDREKSYAIDANYHKGGNPKQYFEFGRRRAAFSHQSSRRAMIQVGSLYPSNGIRGRIYSPEGKSPALKAAITGGGNEPKIGLYVEHTNMSGHKTKHFDKTVALRNASANYQMVNSYRKLTPVECERLQTLADGYTEGVSNTQRYRMLGNGWTVDVLAHIFSYLGE